MDPDPWVSAAKQQEDAEKQTVLEKTGKLSIHDGGKSGCLEAKGRGFPINPDRFGAGLGTGSTSTFGGGTSGTSFANDGFSANFGAPIRSAHPNTFRPTLQMTTEPPPEMPIMKPLKGQDGSISSKSRPTFNFNCIQMNTSVPPLSNSRQNVPKSASGLENPNVRLDHTGQFTNQHDNTGDRFSTLQCESSQIALSDDSLINISANDVDTKPILKDECALLNKLVHKKLEDVDDVQLQVSNLQSDPTSPLYSVKSFQDLRLKPNLIKALFLMGFMQPSKIQEAALPILLCEPPQNMIAQSQSGTGKTAAFVLTMLSRINPDDKWTQCICVAPTFELVLQIGKVVQQMGQFMPEITMAYAIRGVSVAPNAHLRAQIVIGTPGKMIDYLHKYRCLDPAKIRVFVLDEADVMISLQGHQDQSVRIHNEINRANPDCQCLLFSATYEEQVVKFAESIIPSPIIITLRREEQSLTNIKQYYVECSSKDDKFSAMCDLYSGLTIGSCIVFCHTRKSAAWLAKSLQQRQHAVALLSGEFEIETRARIIQEFKEGHHKVLITTNVCARGIDVSQVTIVVNYDPPITTDRQPDFETYLHRIGRTGRFGKSGIAVNFCNSSFELKVIESIAKHFGRPIEKLDTTNTEQLEAIEKD